MTNFSKSGRRSCVVAGLLVLSTLFLSSTAAGQTRRKRRGSTPAAVVKIAETRVINTEEMQGLMKRDGSRPLLVNFWATWCIPCREEFPDFVKIDAEYRPKGLDFIAISLDDLVDLKTEVPKFLKEMKATMPVYLLNVPDPEPAIAAVDRDWNGTLPATFLYDQQGKIVFRQFGRVKTKELRDAIVKLVDSKQ